MDAGKGWRKRRGSEHDGVHVSTRGVVITHGGLTAPLALPLAAIKVATVDAGPARVSGLAGRFPVLRRLSATAVVPREEGIEGWLWTTTGGSGFTALGDEDEAPNVALLLAKPLEETQLRAVFDGAAVDALAARSPLGTPTVPGLVFRVADPRAAELGFKRWHFQSTLTDREVPPALRRHLPTDRPADPKLRGSGEDPRAATSVAPPGMG
jgi:hypothetical protein